MKAAIELRCDANPRRLFAKIKQETGKPPPVVDGNLLEIACRDCARSARDGDASVRQVLHRFNLLGELVETEIVKG